MFFEHISNLRLILSEAFSIYIILSKIDHSNSISANKKRPTPPSPTVYRFKNYTEVWRECKEIKTDFTSIMRNEHTVSYEQN